MLLRPSPLFTVGLKNEELLGRLDSRTDRNKPNYETRDRCCHVMQLLQQGRTGSKQAVALRQCPNDDLTEKSLYLFPSRMGTVLR